MANPISFRSAVAWTIAVFVSVPLAIYLTINTWSSIQGAQERGRLEQLGTEQLIMALPAAEDRLQSVHESVGRDADNTWTQQSCSYSSDDAGWIVQNYREVCHVEAISVWEVGDVTEARSLTRPFAADHDKFDLTNPCRGFGSTSSETKIVFLAAGTDLDDDYSCTELSDDGHRTKTLTGEPSTGITPRSLLVATTTIPLFDEDIGCTRWSVLFCDNPFGDRHAFGEAPTGP